MHEPPAGAQKVASRMFKLPLQYWAGAGEKESKTRYKERTQEVRKLLVSCCTLGLTSYV